MHMSDASDTKGESKTHIKAFFDIKLYDKKAIFSSEVYFDVCKHLLAIKHDTKHTLFPSITGIIDGTLLKVFTGGAGKVLPYTQKQWSSMLAQYQIVKDSIAKIFISAEIDEKDQAKWENNYDVLRTFFNKVDALLQRMQEHGVVLNQEIDVPEYLNEPEDDKGFGLFG